MPTRGVGLLPILDIAWFGGATRVSVGRRRSIDLVALGGTASLALTFIASERIVVLDRRIELYGTAMSDCIAGRVSEKRWS